MHQNVAKEKTRPGLDQAKDMTKQVEDQTETGKKEISFGMSTTLVGVWTIYLYTKGILEPWSN